MHSFILQVLITQYEKQIQKIQEELKEVKDAEVDEKNSILCTIGEIL